jgi:hypothetical protein
VSAAQLQLGDLVPGQVPPQPFVQVLPVQMLAAQAQLGVQQDLVPAQVVPQPSTHVLPEQVLAAQAHGMQEAPLQTQLPPLNFRVLPSAQVGNVVIEATVLQLSPFSSQYAVAPTLPATPSFNPTLGLDVPMPTLPVPLSMTISTRVAKGLIHLAMCRSSSSTVPVLFLWAMTQLLLLSAVPSCKYKAEYVAPPSEIPEIEIMP